MKFKKNDLVVNNSKDRFFIVENCDSTKFSGYRANKDGSLYSSTPTPEYDRDINFFEKIEPIQKKQNEAINHPDHYNWLPGVECISIAQHFNYNLGCAIKYIWRAGRKPDNTVIQDLKKAIRYLQYEIEKIESEGK
jgi:hypothetical protein